MKQEFRIAILLTVLGLLIVWAHPVQAKPPTVVYQDKNMTVTLVTDACLNPRVLARIHPKEHGFFQAGTVNWKGEVFGLCWTVLQDGNVLIVDETGDAGVLPMTGFKRVSHI